MSLKPIDRDSYAVGFQDGHREGKKAHAVGRLGFNDPAGGTGGADQPAKQDQSGRRPIRSVLWNITAPLFLIASGLLAGTDNFELAWWCAMGCLAVHLKQRGV